MKVVLNSEECVGCGLCADVCPEVFEIDEDKDVARVKVEEVPENLKKRVKQVEKDCSGEAIKILE